MALSVLLSIFVRSRPSIIHLYAPNSTFCFFLVFQLSIPALRPRHTHLGIHDCCFVLSIAFVLAYDQTDDETEHADSSEDGEDDDDDETALLGIVLEDGVSGGNMMSFDG